MTILIIAVSSGVLLASLYIGGAIVVKIRTDRCLEEVIKPGMKEINLFQERRRMVTVDPADLNAPPRYREAVQGRNFLSLPSVICRQRRGQIASQMTVSALPSISCDNIPSVGVYFVCVYIPPVLLSPLSSQNKFLFPLK